MPISDQLLSRGCLLNIEAVHGEPVVVISGADAGKTFIGVRELVEDINLSEGYSDTRAKIVMHFRVAPELNPTDIIRTSDGKRWHAIRQPGNSFMETNFELSQLTTKDK